YYVRRLNENRGWHTEIEQLSGLEINDELETGRLLYRQVSGALASQDLVDVGGGTPPCLHKGRGIGYQSPGVDLGTQLIRGWQSAFSRQIRNGFGAGEEGC